MKFIFTKKERLKSITTQFFRETKGGTRPEDLSLETESLILKNIKNLEETMTPGVQRMVKIFRKYHLWS